MISVRLLNSAFASAILTHLLQSTAFVVLAWLLTLALRNYPARVRFWVWMTGSIKFLVPFALLTSLGMRFATLRPQHLHTVLYTVVEQFNLPLAKANPVPAGISSNLQHVGSWVGLAIVLVWGAGSLLMLLRWTMQWLHAHRLVETAEPVNGGPEFLALRNAESRSQVRKAIPIALASTGRRTGDLRCVFPCPLVALGTLAATGSGTNRSDRGA